MIKKVFSVNAMEWIAPSSQATVSSCDSNRCLCCMSFIASPSFASYCTGRKFIFDRKGFFSCKSKNVIYLITCKKCGIQYVGQTTQALHCRLNGHRSAILGNQKNTYLSNHFRSEGHCIGDLSIQIIDIIDESKCKDKSELVKELNKKEDFYIKTLNTMYPLGLNDKLLGGGCVSRGTVNLESYFSSPIPRCRRSHGKRKRKSKMSKLPDSKTVLENLRNLFNSNQLRLFYQTLKSLSIRTLKQLCRMTVAESNNFTFVFTAFAQATCFNVNNSNDKFNKIDKTYIVFPFKNHDMDKLEIHSILHDRGVCRLLPDKVSKLYPPKIFFSLNNPVSLKLCNYSKFLNSLNIEKIKDVLRNDCYCNIHRKFVYDQYQHVLTGDMSFVKDSKLRKLFELGTKHRLSKHVKTKETLDDIQYAIDQHIKRVSTTNKIPPESFSDWKTKILKLAKDRLYKKASNEKPCNEIRLSSDLLKELQSIHDHFVVVPVDKASSNYSFICKKFYILVLLKELGFDLNNLEPKGNITYAIDHRKIENIISQHCDDLYNLFKIRCKEENKKVARLYWLPKLHKTPYKFRFIAGARHSTTKSLSIKINKGLSVIRDHFRRYCEAIYNNSGINCFWSILSSVEFLDKMKSLKVFNIEVFDFSTLYTNLDQNEVKSHIFSLLDLVFNSSTRRYLCIGFEKSFLSKIEYRGYHTFTIDSFKKAIEFIIDEVFVTFGGCVFRQVNGIPMGGNCSPLLADLFLLHCEYVFMTNLMNNKMLGLARILSNTSRYIDDLCLINYKHFESLIPKIYPNSLKASKSGNDSKNVEYLDIMIKITQSGIRTSVYHKVDDFPFEVTLLTFPDNCAPAKLGLHVFGSQVIRYGRLSSSLEDFLLKTHKTFDILSSRGYGRHLLRSVAEKVLHRNKEILHKFGIFSAREISDKCLPLGQRR